MNPPSLPQKTKNYNELPNYLPQLSNSLNYDYKENPFLSHPKRYGFVTNGENDALRDQSKIFFTVKIYKPRVGSKILYICNGVTFSKKNQADKYCYLLNKEKFLKSSHTHCHHRSITRNHRNSLTRSSSDLTDRRNSISKTRSLSRGRKYSPSRRNGVVFGSNDNLLLESNYKSRSTSNSSGRRRSSSSRRRSSSLKRRSSSSRSSLSKSLENLHISSDSD
uniref:Si:dkey-2n12.1 protein (inferred by orthology to a zebrafish protein) n=1 Tax=Strongyloides venezuelensis TaxID=75913 RepID=A0A0K0FD03_STRVS